jgi:ribosomal protein L30E
MKEIKDAIAKKKAVIGKNEVMKALKKGTLKEIILSSNCPENTVKDINHYKQISNIKVKSYKGTAKELGVFCGKPFSIAVMGIKGKSK